MNTDQYQLEYTLMKVSQDRLWKMISTEMGLNEWITGEVSVSGDGLVRFQWTEEYYDEAQMEIVDPGKQIRFHWLSSEDFFDLCIHSEELTGDKVLTITDHASPTERAMSMEIWQQQVSTLCHRLGIRGR